MNWFEHFNQLLFQQNRETTDRATPQTKIPNQHYIPHHWQQNSIKENNLLILIWLIWLFIYFTIYIINPHACFHLLPPNYTNQPTKNNSLSFFSYKVFMESSMNNAFIMSKHETAMFTDDQNPEESSWTMYFEDFFEASSSIVDVGDFSSSSVSDAASFVATKKTLNVSKQEGSNLDIKRTRNREIPFGRHHDLEDTASSPSGSPNVSIYISLSLSKWIHIILIYKMMLVWWLSPRWSTQKIDYYYTTREN